MKKILILLIALSLILSSCGSKKNITTTKKPTTETTSKEESTVTDPTKVIEESETNDVDSSPKRVSTQLYINKYAGIAKEEMEIYKIPASITLAQGILESSSGNSELTKKSNNHFGVKCHQKWTGERTYYDDDEKGECFRVYKEAASSFKDHSEFLNGRRRYSFLFKFDKGDYVSWAQGLRQAGYATDNQYPQKLIRIIEKYQLYQYDKEVLGEAYKKEGKNTLSHLVKKGETLHSIGAFYGISAAKLKKLNHLTSSTVFVGQRITLRSESVIDATSSTEDIVADVPVATEKVDKKTPIYHVVKQGESLFAISRKYKLSVKKLKEYNNLASNDIKIGQKMYLKSVDKSLLAPGKDEVVTEDKVLLDNKDKEIITTKEKTVVSGSLVDQDNIPYHVVEEKESLFAISRKYKLSIKKLKKYNNLASDDIKIGQKLYLKPVDMSLLTPVEIAVEEKIEKVETIIPETKEPTIVKDEVKQTTEVVEKAKPLIENKEEEVVAEVKEEAPTNLPMKSISKNETPPDFHIVKKGETLYAIAYKYNLEIPMFRKMNGLKTDNVHVGQYLRLRKGVVLPKTAKSKNNNTKSHTHTVVKGDTLYSIATRNLLTVGKLKQLNNLKDNTIIIGQVLVLE